MSFRDGPKDQTSDVQLHIGESRDSGFALRAPRNDARFWALVRRWHEIHLPADRWTGMAVEEALRGDGETLGMIGIRRHPGVADRQPCIRRIADADKPEAPRLLQRGQPGRPELAGRERRRMIRTVERHRLADLRG